MSQPITLVTGASRGIGLATIARLARDGHKVVGLSRTAPPKGTPCEFFAADLADPAATDRVLKEVTARFQVDNLVNNAGVPVPDRAGEVTLKGWEQVLGVNLRASLQCMQAVLPAMKAKKRGRIVSIGSRAAQGKAERSAYAAAKAGIIGLSRTWALEVGQHGITVNVVAPGPIITELFEQNNSRAYIERLEKQNAVGRLGRPEDVAAAVRFFLSDEAGFITGQTLYVCGGMSVGQAPI